MAKLTFNQRLELADILENINNEDVLAELISDIIVCRDVFWERLQTIKRRNYGS